MQRPTSWLVFGIIHLVIAAMNILGTGFSVLMMTLLQHLPGADKQLEILRRGGLLGTWMWVLLGLGVVFSVVLVVAGIGLIRNRPNGRTLSLVYAGYAVLAAFAGAAVSWSVMDEQAAASPLGPGFVYVIQIASLLFALAYPVLIVIFIGPDPRKRALSDSGGARPPSENPYQAPGG